MRLRNRAIVDHRSSRIRTIPRAVHGCHETVQGRLLAADESPMVVEGTWDGDKVVLLWFPDEAAYREWAESPDYQEIVKDRKAGTSCRARFRHAGLSSLTSADGLSMATCSVNRAVFCLGPIGQQSQDTATGQCRKASSPVMRQQRA